MSDKLLVVWVTVDMDGGYQTMKIGRKNILWLRKAKKKKFHGKKTFGSVLVIHNTKHYILLHGNSLYVYPKLSIT